MKIYAVLYDASNDIWHIIYREPADETWFIYEFDVYADHAEELVAALNARASVN